jgi:osmoprotectant transport system permease protein
MSKFFRTFFGILLALPVSSRAQQVTVASKPFGESYLLAEMFSQLLEGRGLTVVRRPGLGATEVAFAAIRSGAIDVYPEYTGTGLVAVLHDSLPGAKARDKREVFAHVYQRFRSLYGIEWLAPLGFENTYAIATRKETAVKFNLHTLSDLARESSHLRAGFTSDFIGRSDGLPGLSKTYGMKFRDVRSLSPALKYQALASGGVDVIDGYSTDGLLAKYDLVTLADDRGFFPPYEAAAMIGPALARNDKAVAALAMLSGRLDEATMRKLNQRVEVDREDVASVARDELTQLGLINASVTPAKARSENRGGLSTYIADRKSQIASETLRHLALSLAALIAAIAVAVPLGLVLERSRGLSEITLGSLGVIETIPSIALLAFMIPLFGIGAAPALVALWLYALYPIARATFTGVREADPDAVSAAEALGVTPVQRLLWIRLPLAAPVIMAGIRTAAVLTIGAATLAAFIGAGGLGEPIVQGLALADTRLVLSGAIPAALLAIVVDRILAVAERRLRPAHLRADATASETSQPA